MEISTFFDNAQFLSLVLENGKTAVIKLEPPGLYCVYLQSPDGDCKRVYDCGSFIEAFEFLCDFGIPQLTK